jgi:hypothetical protein
VSEPQVQLELDEMDLFVMYSGFMRYSMGRMTSAPDYFKEVTKQVFPKLHHIHRSMIFEELCSEVNSNEKLYEGSDFLEQPDGSTLGHTVDFKTWKETLSIMLQLGV